MEAAGAVFLPAAGYRRGMPQQIFDIDEIGAYWSTSNIKVDDNDPYSRNNSCAQSRDYAYYIYFDPANIGAYEYINRSCGCSVRLVKDAK
ncbi:MAG: hypothetical protein MJZ45_03230 [Bacteroidales bacterium]|nr:hypothetical protein [Bacteroidales bacterium]